MFQPLSIEAAARTEVGRCRQVNQDALAVRPDLGLHVLADGMTGCAAGEVASGIAVEVMQQFYVDAGATWPVDAEGPPTDPRAFLIASAKLANYRIWQLGELHAEYRGMGAAVAAVHVGRAGFCLAHVGHVRGYRFREGALAPLTEDHTVPPRCLDQGAAHAAAQTQLGVTRLVRALGMRASVQVTARLEDARPGDLVALVSNGLYNAVSDWQMASILTGRAPLDEMAASLVSVAQAHDAPDDVSCILLRWIAEAGAPNIAA